MADPEKDQVKEESQETEDIQPDQSKETQEEEKEAPELPEKDHFKGDNMEKWAEEMDLFDKPEPKPVKKAKTEEEEECVGCDEEKEAREKGKPYATLVVKGKKKAVYSKEEYDKLAQKGAYMTEERQKDAEWERGLDDREKALESRERDATATEERLDKLAEPLNELVGLFKSGKFTPPASGETEDERLEEEEDLEPEVRLAIKKRDDKIRELTEKLDQVLDKSKEGEKVTETAKRDKALTALNAAHEKIRGDFPYEEYNHDEYGPITEDLYTGLVAVKVNKDVLLSKKDPNVKIRPMTDYMKDAARDLLELEKHHRSNGSPEDLTITAESVIEQYPDVADEIGQEAVTRYLNNLKGQPRTAKSIKTDAQERETVKKQKDKRKMTVDEIFEEAGKDPVISDAIEKAQEQSKRLFST
jgi:hypothetical protein